MDDQERNDILNKITPVTFVNNIPVRSQDLNMMYNMSYKYNIMNLNCSKEYSYIAPYSAMARTTNTNIIIDFICNNINDMIQYFINCIAGDILRASENSSIAESSSSYIMSLFDTIYLFNQHLNIQNAIRSCISVDIERLMNYIYELPEMDRTEEVAVAVGLLKPKIFSTMMSIIDQWIIFYTNYATEIIYPEDLEGRKINVRTLYAVIYEYCNETPLVVSAVDSTIADQYQLTVCMIREMVGLYHENMILGLDGIMTTAINMILFNQKPDSSSFNAPFIIDQEGEETEDEDNIVVTIDQDAIE